VFLLALGGPVFSSAALIQLAADLALKSALVCSLAGLLALVLRPASASVRDLVWRCAILVLLSLPVLALLPPAWEVGVLPDLTYIDLASELERNDGVPALAPVADAVAPDVPGATDHGIGSRWSEVILLLVGVGCFLALCRMLLARLQVHGILGRALPPDATWQEDLESYGRLLGVTRRIRLRASSEIGAGITVGAFRPHIILPEEARRWPRYRRRAVIAHELAHVRRRDVLFEHLIALVTIIYWYQPLVWLAIPRLRDERERACDDLVLQCGLRPGRYAVQLMQIAKGLGRPARAGAHVGTLCGTGMNERLRHILRAGARRSPVSLRAGVAGYLVTATLTVTLAATGFWAIERDPLEGPPGAVLDPKVQDHWSRIDDRRYSAAYLVERVLAAEGVVEAVAAFDRLTSRKTVLDYYVHEEELNSLGYRLLNRQRLPEAIAIFKLNTVAFPDSWNVHDSLGEAYLAAGSSELAHASYQRSLALGSQNVKAARQTLRDLEHRLGRD
jgi:beta-lactamase regulating signal transducer with metallopeptidase domain